MMEKIQHREAVDTSKSYKEAYVTGIERIIANREESGYMKRNTYSRNIFQDQEKYREDLKKMLGWPLTEKGERVVPEARFEKLAEETYCTIYRVSIHVFDEFEISGLFFRKEGKKPLVVVQHGGGGTPEVISNLYGETYNYNEMTERMLQEEVHVFAPQLLLWYKENYGVEYDRIALDARLKRVGSSITALEVYAIMRVVDYFEVQDYVNNFGMVGLSYGGFYTLFTTALDTRIKSAVSCAFYNKRSDFARPDWTWFGATDTFSDAEVACLCYPRRLCIEVGIEDEIFAIEGARTEMYRLKEKSEEVGTEWIDYIEFDGVHEFCLDDGPLKRLADDIQ